MIRSPSNALLLLGLLAGCGGQVGIGTLAAADGGTGAPGSPGTKDGGMTNPPGSTVNPASCGTTSTTAEVLLDIAGTGDEAVTDFYGDGTKLMAGVNYIGNFRAGRVVTLTQPTSSPVSSVPEIDLSPAYVRRIGPGLSTIFMAIDPASREAELKVVPNGTSGGASESLPLTELPVFASHPQRSEAFYVTTSSAPEQDSVRSWSGSGQPTQVMVLPTHLRARSLSTDKTELGVLVEDTLGLRATHRILRPPSMAGGGPYEEVAPVDAEVVSNLVVHGGAYYVAAMALSGGKFVVYRFRVENGSTTQSDVIGEVATGADSGARIEVDDTHVYLAHGLANPACGGGPFCSSSLDLVRFQKEAIGVGNPPTAVKTFTGAAPAEKQYRPFNVDACFVYWYDATERRLYRQGK